MMLEWGRAIAGAEPPLLHYSTRLMRDPTATALGLEFGIELQGGLRQVAGVKTTTKRRAKSEAELLDHATNNLLRALKQDMVKKEGGVDREKLRKEGYSDRLLAKLEQA
jgi:hypothetical protein